MQVEAGGQLGQKISKPEAKISEIVGLAAAMLILVLVFGTVTAMALPIAAAIVGLISGLSLISMLGHLTSVPDVAPTIATMIGLGVGIDYSLFIVTRARSARHEGMSVHDAIGHAAATSGSAVAFAGVTVIIALLSLAVSGVSLITVLGQAAAIAVVVAVLASMTLLPAMLGLCGDRIEKLRVGRDKRPTLDHSSFWERWGGRLARRPAMFAVAAVMVLLAVASPVKGLELGLTDNSSSPQSTTVRQAYDLITDNYGAGANGPLLVTANVDGKDDPELAKLHEGLSGAGAQAVGEPQMSEDGSAALINVIPNGSPTSDATSDLVDTVRDDIVPASGADANVGGSTAQQLDLADLIGQRLPLIIAVVVGLSVLLLLIAFRSVVAPLQAAFVNLLAVGAAYGVLTAVFQEGHGAASIGLDGAIPIVSYVPMMMFAILFGLAMDYQVFLLSRVREEIDAGKSPRRAVIDGLAGTGKVIALGGGDHGRGLRQLHPQRRSDRQGVRRRPRLGDRHRRDDGLRPAPGRDARDGPLDLVAPAQPRPRPPPHQRRRRPRRLTRPSPQPPNHPPPPPTRRSNHVRCHHRSRPGRPRGGRGGPPHLARSARSSAARPSPRSAPSSRSPRGRRPRPTRPATTARRSAPPSPSSSRPTRRRRSTTRSSSSTPPWSTPARTRATPSTSRSTARPTPSTTPRTGSSA